MSGSVLDRVRVLVADDRAELRTLLRDMLSEIGFNNVESAADGGDAYCRFLAQPAGLVITDLRMAPVDGLALTHMIRTAPDSPHRAAPILMTSGEAEERWCFRRATQG